MRTNVDLSNASLKLLSGGCPLLNFFFLEKLFLLEAENFSKFLK